MNIRKELAKVPGAAEDMSFNDLDVNPKGIRAIMINEIVSSDPEDDSMTEEMHDIWRRSSRYLSVLPSLLGKSVDGQSSRKG